MNTFDLKSLKRAIRRTWRRLVGRSTRNHSRKNVSDGVRKISDVWRCAVPNCGGKGLISDLRTQCDHSSTERFRVDDRHFTWTTLRNGEIRAITYVQYHNVVFRMSTLGQTVQHTKEPFLRPNDFDGSPRTDSLRAIGGIAIYKDGHHVHTRNVPSSFRKKNREEICYWISEYAATYINTLKMSKVHQS